MELKEFWDILSDGCKGDPEEMLKIVDSISAGITAEMKRSGMTPPEKPQVFIKEVDDLDS